MRSDVHRRTALRWGLMRLLPVVLLLSMASLAAAGEDLRLVEAVKTQDAAAHALLTEGIDVNAAQPDGATALHWAAYWDDWTMAEQLIRHGASVNAANAFGVTPLALACLNGSAPMIETLLAAGADPNVARPTGETALMTAVDTGTVDAVQALLARGANVRAREARMGQTALMWAIAERHLDVARVLIESGADVRARSYGGFSPLLFAAREGDVPAARLLLARGADVNATAADGSSVLHVATVRGQVEFATFLLDQGADSNADGPGYTPLHWAAGRWESAATLTYPVEDGEWSVLVGLPTASARKELMAALLAHGADPNARLETGPPLGGLGSWRALVGTTAFYLAAAQGDVGAMRLLLDHGADPSLATSRGSTPLMAASGSMLFKYVGTNVGRVGPDSRHLDAATLCVELGADINAANTEGNTALHVAAEQGFDTMIQFLVDAGAAVNATNQKGDTPLAVALLDTARVITSVISQSTVDLLRTLGGVVE